MTWFAAPWILLLVASIVGWVIRVFQERDEAERISLLEQCSRYGIVPPYDASIRDLRAWLQAAQDRRIAMFSNRRRTDTMRSRGVRR